MKKFTLFLSALLISMVSMAANYVKVAAAPADWSGEYLLVYEGESATHVWTGVDAANGNVEATATDGTISGTDFVTITVAQMEGGYSIKVNGGANDGKYISGTNGSNKLNFGTEAALNTLAYEDGSVKIVSNTSVMRFNSAKDNMRFRYFKSTSYTAQKTVQLYKNPDTTTPVDPVEPEGPENLGAKTIAEFLELKNTTDTCVLTGVVANIANTTYGNFDLVDATGTVYVYGLLTAAGESKQFASMDIAAGDTLTVKAIYNEYNSKPQAKNAIYVSHRKTATPIVPENLGAKTIAEFLELKNTTDTCVLTGVVANITNTTYGNFDLVDATGSVYVYGLLTAAGESKQFASMDIAAGDELTVKAIYNEFNGNPQAKNAIYVSHSKILATALENIAVEDKAVKAIVNGQLTIIKNGVQYNAQGAVVK